ncbi:MAG TPA: nitronate monooxygenase, partial [Desulfovibrio sp.]|nr:nitronate monooxygenase [Desulfovibrio sp.]
VIAKKWESKTGLLPDAFVVEGPKAGGHLGYKYEEITDPNHSLEHIVPEVVETVKALEDKKGQAIPVIAGGGIYSGEDIANIMALGASGVQMGTRFVATNECDADIKFKEAFVNAKEEDITIINSPVGMPGRALFNSFIEAVRDGKKRPVSCAFHCVSTCTQEKTPYCIAAALIAAMRGNLEKGFAFCGTNVNKIKSIVSVKELMESLQAEYDNFKAKF